MTGGGGVRNTETELKTGAEEALAEAIANLSGVDAGSVADRLDAAVSSRSSHQWDPDGYIDEPISSAGGATAGEVQTEATEDTVVDLLHGAPRSVAVIDNGGVVGHAATGLELYSGTGGDSASVVIAGAPENGQFTGTIRFGARWFYNNAIGDLTDRLNSGLGDNLQKARPDNGAIFRPDQGDNADGNVVVMSGGNQQATGAVDYPDLRTPTYYEVAMDFSASETRFYIDSTDTDADVPNATLADVPSLTNGLVRGGVGRKTENGIGDDPARLFVQAVRGGMSP